MWGPVTPPSDAFPSLLLGPQCWGGGDGTLLQLRTVDDPTPHSVPEPLQLHLPKYGAEFRKKLYMSINYICVYILHVYVYKYIYIFIVLHLNLIFCYTYKLHYLYILHMCRYKLYMCIYIAYTYICMYINICSVQLLSHVQLFVTPWTAVRQASLSITNSQSLLKLMSIELVMPSNHLIPCCPLLLLPSIFPSIRVFSNKSVLHIRWPNYWSFSLSISPANEYSGLISFRMAWLDLLSVQGYGSNLDVHQQMNG